MGKLVCIRIHSQIHQLERKNTRVWNTYGVSGIELVVEVGCWLEGLCLLLGAWLAIGWCSLEEALMSREPNDILTKILIRFILNLKPQTRNLKWVLVSLFLLFRVTSTVSSLMVHTHTTPTRAPGISSLDFFGSVLIKFRLRFRGCWPNISRRMNGQSSGMIISKRMWIRLKGWIVGFLRLTGISKWVDIYNNLIFLPWHQNTFLGWFQLKILRQLVELQLTHSLEIKATIDRAWGVVHNKHKKEKGVGAAGSSATASSELDRQFLGFQPYGYDAKRARYWVVDSACLSFIHIWS